jgi:Spy/CpxP family protein refolding chaperone
VRTCNAIQPEEPIMFTRILCIGVLSLSSVLALAAEKGAGPGPNRADYLDKVAILLDLNEGQKVQLQQVLDEQHQQMQVQMKSLREQAQTTGQRPDRTQMRAQHLQADKDLVDKLRPVLTDVQLKKFEALRELTGPRPGGPHPRGQRPERRERN